MIKLGLSYWQTSMSNLDY